MVRFKRILLVNPPKSEQGGYKPSPLGLLYLAAYLRKYCPKIKVEIADGAINGKKEVFEKFKKIKPQLVGITSLTPRRHQSLEIARFLKKLNPRCKTVFGGIHPTIMWRQMMSVYPEIDYIVRGEGEETLYDLVAGKRLIKIKGLVWRKGKNIVNNQDRKMISDLDKLPFPAWDMIDPTQYPAWGKGKVDGIDLEKEVRYSIIFSRGCMAYCTFCSSWKVWRGYRYRSGKNVADEIEMLVKKYQAKHFAFYDDTLTGSREEMISFCKEIINRKLKIAIHGTTRVDKVDLQMLYLMKKAGFYQIAYGIESGSPAMLLKINKRIDLEKTIKAVKMTKKVGIQTSALMMYGLPQEREEDRVLTKKLLKKIKPDVLGTVGEVWIFPGTALYEQAKNAKLINDQFWLTKKPYYIYRGGIGNDPIKWHLKLKDWIMFLVWGTSLEKSVELIFIRAQRFKLKIIRSLTKKAIS